MSRQEIIDEYQHAIDMFERMVESLDNQYGVYMGCTMECEIVASTKQDSVAMHFARICGSSMSGSTKWITARPLPTKYAHSMKPREINNRLLEIQERDKTLYKQRIDDLVQRKGDEEMNLNQFDVYIPAWDTEKSDTNE